MRNSDDDDHGGDAPPTTHEKRQKWLGQTQGRPRPAPATNSSRPRRQVAAADPGQGAPGSSSSKLRRCSRTSWARARARVATTGCLLGAWKRAARSSVRSHVTSPAWPKSAVEGDRRVASSERKEILLQPATDEYIYSCGVKKKFLYRG